MYITFGCLPVDKNNTTSVELQSLCILWNSIYSFMAFVIDSREVVK